MAEQEPLWVDSLAEALTALVEAPELGGPKALGAALWPTLGPAEAGRKLRHSLDPERAEKLALEEVEALLRVGARSGVHVAMRYLGDALGYSVRPVAPRDAAAEARAEFVAAVKHLDRLSERLGRMQAEDAEASDSLTTLARGRR